MLSPSMIWSPSLTRYVKGLVYGLVWVFFSLHTLCCFILHEVILRYIRKLLDSVRSLLTFLFPCVPQVEGKTTSLDQKLSFFGSDFFFYQTPQWKTTILLRIKNSLKDSDLT